MPSQALFPPAHRLQLSPVDLSQSGARKRGKEFHGFGSLVGCERCFTELDQRLRVAEYPVFEYHKRFYRFAPFGALETDHRDFRDRRILAERIFNLLRENTDASAFDHVLLAPGHG